VAFENLIQLSYRLDESGLALRVLDEDLDEGGDVVSKITLVQERDVSANDPASLEFPDPFVDRRRGQANRLGHVGLGDLGVILQESQDLSIGGVQPGPILLFC